MRCYRREQLLTVTSRGSYFWSHSQSGSVTLELRNSPERQEEYCSYCFLLSFLADEI